jgi:hypothetical protein
LKFGKRRQTGHHRKRQQKCQGQASTGGRHRDGWGEGWWDRWRRMTGRMDGKDDQHRTKARILYKYTSEYTHLHM